MNLNDESINKCSCGNNRNSESVYIKTEYTPWGWLWMLLGISAVPVKVNFICRKCGQTLDTLTSKEELKKYTGR